MPAVLALARDHQVLVTVDCGITSIQETEAAQAAGMQVIITDHHQPGAALRPGGRAGFPAAGGLSLPLPVRGGGGLEAGDGAAWGGGLPLISIWRRWPRWRIWCPFEGRIGPSRPWVFPCWPGRSGPACGRCCAWRGWEILSAASRRAFNWPPALTPAGAWESARTALELLRTRSVARGEELALKMDALNQERKKQEARVIAEAELQAGAVDFAETSALVVAGEDWNSGVVGLAAGRIAEEYACPTVALARDGENYVGSARSAGDVDIHAALSPMRRFVFPLRRA